MPCFRYILFDSLQQVTKFFSETLATWAGYFEKFLSDGREWVLSTRFSVADIAMFHYFSEYNKLHPECFAATPLVLAHAARVAARPKIAAYLAARPVTAW
jgi:glutathione S-transferase